MKKLIFIFLSVLAFASCSKEEEGMEVENPDEYYVKYEAKGQNTLGRGTIYITYRGEDSKNETVEMSFGGRREITIGPVAKGFNCRIELSSSSPNLNLYSKIFVSKNNSPFAIKANDEVGAPLNTVLTYAIDY